MRVLALDTTNAAGSVALVDDERVIAERRGDPSRTHAERLPAEILALLAESTLGAIDLFAVASGPGSFTGLRVGIATMQGLAFVHGGRLVGISALEALAQMASLNLEPGALVAAWMDAHRREVFSALYRVAPAAPLDPDRLVEIEAASVGDPAATLGRWPSRVETFIGDGAVRYADVIRGRAGTRAAIVEPPAVAGAIGRLAVAHAARGAAVAPHGIQPLYVRRPDAEVDRERKTR